MSNSLLKYINNKGIGTGIDDVSEFTASSFPDPSLLVAGSHAQLGSINFTTINGKWSNIGGSYWDFKLAIGSNENLKFKDGTILKFNQFYNDSPLCDIYLAFISTEPLFDDTRVKVDNGWLMQIFPEGKLSFECFGAYGDYVRNLSRNDNVALQSSLKYAKGVMQLIYQGTPHKYANRSITIEPKCGYYTHSDPLPLFSGLKIVGSAPALLGATNVIKYTGTNSQFIFSENTSGPQYATNGAMGVAFENVHFRGNTECNSYPITPNSVANNGMVFSQIINCNYSYFKKLDIGMTGGRIIGCDFNKMPWGCLLIHGSDWIVERNFINSAGIPEVNTGSIVETQHIHTVAFSGSANGRFNKNYITGSEGPVKPMCCFVADSYDLDLTENWYDLSDGPCIVLYNAHHIRCIGGRICYAGVNPPAVDEIGNSVGSRYACSILIYGSSYDCELGSFRLTNNTGPTYRFNDGAGSGKFILRESTYSGTTENPETIVIPSNWTSAKIFSEYYSRNIIDFSTSVDLVPRLQDLQYRHSASGTTGAVLVMATATVGRKITLWLNNATQVTGFNIQATDTFRGQGSNIKIRAAGGQEGKFITLMCNTANVWDVQTNATVTYSV